MKLFDTSPVNRTNTEVCDKCGQKYRCGEWPFCPHGEGLGMLGEFKSRFEEHISPDGAQVSSLAQRRRLMKENGLDYKGKKVGMPGCEV